MNTAGIASGIRSNEADTTLAPPPSYPNNAYYEDSSQDQQMFDTGSIDNDNANIWLSAMEEKRPSIASTSSINDDTNPRSFSANANTKFEQELDNRDDSYGSGFGSLERSSNLSASTSSSNNYARSSRGSYEL